MLDYFCIFTKGGAILWTFQLAALKGEPVQALIRTCLLEERSAEKSFSYTPKDGAAYTLKWRLSNEVGLVFVAVYQRALSLTYVDELLDSVVGKFLGEFDVQRQDYSTFNDTFRQLVLEAEKQSAERAKMPRAAPRPSAAKASGGGQKAAVQKAAETDEDDEDDDTGSDGDAEQLEPAPQADASVETMEDRLKKLKLGRRGARGSGAKAHKPDKEEKKADEKKPKKGKQMRNWNNLYAGQGEEEAPQKLDFACDSPKKAPMVEESIVGPSGMDIEADVAELDMGELEEEDGGDPQKGGFLASMVRSLKVSVIGGEPLKRSDIEPALDALKKKLMERNVGHDIVGKIADSVALSLEGKKIASFTRISKVVYTAVEEALVRILTPARSIDILREVQANRAKPGKRPYVVTFVGVNGVGKSTNLAKVAYWLMQHNVKVMIAACDTFRSGAVEQLRTHCQRLGVALYERGYEKDPAKVRCEVLCMPQLLSRWCCSESSCPAPQVAFEGVKQAEREGADVLLVDTAGRMQDNDPLMRALAHLISLNKPELVLFVGEALVGNDAIDQLTKFNQRLTDLADSQDARTRAIDGIVLTKFDTIDDKVGAAISMVYTSGAPVMFVGCGQTYVDLKRLNTKEVVNSLLG